jgi:hypothetical protein
VRLVWKPQTSEAWGRHYELTGLPDNAFIYAYRVDVGRYFAGGIIKGSFVAHYSGNIHKAMRLLERELDKRSIGLFGVDVVEFEQEAFNGNA